MNNINELTNNEKKYKSFFRTIIEYIFIIAGSILISLVILQFFKLTQVSGHSMDNTLADNQRLLLNLKAYSNEEPKYKDIVVIKQKTVDSEYIIKRVIGLPGDHIVIKDNKISVNGTILNEPYIKEAMVTDDIDVIVPAGKIWAMGDNRNHSADSRYFSFFDINSQIVGKVIFNFSTFSKIK